MLTLSTDCRERVDRVLDRVSSMLLSTLEGGAYVTLADVLEEAYKVIEEAGFKPCVAIASAEEYYAFLKAHLEALARAIFHKSMEASAKHLERLGFGLYALISVTLVGYAMSLLQLLDTVRSLLPAIPPERLGRVEATTLAAALRFMGLCRLIETLRPRELRRYVGRLVAIVERFNREDGAALEAALGGVHGGSEAT